MKNRFIAQGPIVGLLGLVLVVSIITDGKPRGVQAHSFRLIRFSGKLTNVLLLLLLRRRRRRRHLCCWDVRWDPLAICRFCWLRVSPGRFPMEGKLSKLTFSFADASRTAKCQLPHMPVA